MDCKQLNHTLQALGLGPIKSCQNISGGSVCDSYLAALENGSRLLIKTLDRPPSRLFESEVIGLKAIERNGCLLTPKVIFVQPHCLALEYIVPGGKSINFWNRLGRQLAQMHRQPQKHFGFVCDNYCGATPQPNPTTGNGYDFFAEHRLGYQSDLALKRGLISHSDRQAIAAIGGKLAELIPNEPPALVHGDLWHGNILCSRDQSPYLIDPACYWGWRESDLAMTLLFGGFDEAFYRAYQDLFPLTPGWRDRAKLYNLYHLLNHLNLFGRSYLPGIKATIECYL